MYKFIKQSGISAAKIKLYLAANLFLSLMDFVGIVVLGLIGTLTASTLSSSPIGDRTSYVLDILGIEGQSLQVQVAVLGLSGAAILLVKTLNTMYLAKRLVTFLNYNCANVTVNLVNRFFQLGSQRVQGVSLQRNIFSLTNGVETLVVGIMGGISLILVDLTLLTILFVGLIYLDPQIAFGLLGIFALVAVSLTILLSNRLRSFSKATTRLTISGNEQLSNLSRAYKDFWVRNTVGNELVEIRKTRTDIAKVRSMFSYLSSVSKYLFEIVMVFAALAIAAYQFLILPANRAIAMIAIVIGITFRVVPAIYRVQQGWLKVRTGFALVEPTLVVIREVSSMECTQFPTTKFSVKHDSFIPRVSLSSVSFSYDSTETNQINNITFDIHPGDLVGIVGRSGAGKSTLVDLILGILRPNSGDIKVSGLSPENAIMTWPGAVAYVPQSTTIFNGSVRSNLLCGYSNVEDSHMWKALEIAQLSEVVSRFDKGLDEELLEGGFRLSGGQKQRLGIARALLTKPRLVVFDEATSALDDETEIAITEALDKLRGTTTMIVIAHRISTLRKANKIIEIENGCLISEHNQNFEKKHLMKDGTEWGLY